MSCGNDSIVLGVLLAFLGLDVSMYGARLKHAEPQAGCLKQCTFANLEARCRRHLHIKSDAALRYVLHLLSAILAWML